MDQQQQILPCLSLSGGTFDDPKRITTNMERTATLMIL